MTIYYEKLSDGTIGKYTSNARIAELNGFTDSTEEEITDIEGKTYLYSDYLNIIESDEYKSRQEAEKRKKLDKLTLTPSDVERALYKARGIDFEDVKNLIKDIPGTDMKALGIELRANLFYRGSVWVDKIGKILGFSTEDLDFLFMNKSLPEESAGENPEV